MFYGCMAGFIVIAFLAGVQFQKWITSNKEAKYRLIDKALVELHTSLVAVEKTLVEAKEKREEKAKENEQTT